MSARDARFAGHEFDRRLGELVTATADDGDPRIDRAVREVLRLVREHMGMDVAFVSEFSKGMRVFRYVDSKDDPPLIAPGGADPLAQSFCQRVLDGRLPQLVHDVAALPNLTDLPATAFPIGAHLSTPIMLADGSVYGTLCCFSATPDEGLTQRDLKRLQMAARMVGRLIDKNRTQGG